MDRRALNNIKNAAIRNYNDKSIWYAVLLDEEDNDFGTGSSDFDNAVDMLVKFGGEQIVIVDESDGFCLGEIHYDDIADFI